MNNYIKSDLMRYYSKYDYYTLLRHILEVPFFVFNMQLDCVMKKDTRK